MSLVIFVSPKTVIISKFKLEFAFHPPARNLSQAAIGAYQLLRQSESIQIESTRDERQEAITLLRQYGLELFKAIVPVSHQPTIHQAGGVFIYTRDTEISHLPWELLYDGTSFFALTQGIVRINDSNASDLPDLSHEAQLSLKICLSSYLPTPPIPPGNRFINYVEGLSTGSFSDSALVDFHINGNSRPEDLLSSLGKHPNLFLFSGHENEAGLVLDGSEGDRDWFNRELAPALRKAVDNGLRILILVTSRMLKSNGQNSTNPLSRYFDLGIPYIISVNGRIARHRFQEYFQNFIVGLLREENILRCHRHAINSIFTSLPLSWDWSWIQLHLNQKALEQKFDTPLPPFRFVNDNSNVSFHENHQQHRLINSRRFYGSYSILNQITSILLSDASDKVLSLQTRTGNPLEEYLQEFFRRLYPRHPFQLCILYYQRWGYHKNQREKLPATPIGNLFPFYFGHKNVGTYFDQYLIHQTPATVGDPDLKYLVVLYPPERYDTSFDAWLANKQKSGWRIIFLSDDSALSKRPMEVVSTDRLAADEISNAFEDDLPEQWIDLVSDPLPDQLMNLPLLKIAQHAKQTEVTGLFLENRTSEDLWRQTLHTVLPTLSSNRFRIFLALYLLRVPCSKPFLAELLGIKKVEPELNHLLRLHLISTNLSNTEVWIPANINQAIEQFQLISENQLLGFGRELLQRQAAMMKGTTIPGITRICGFQYCINTLADLGQIDNPLQRNIQFGRKLSRLSGTQPALFYPNVCTSLELVLSAGKKQDIQKTILSILDIIGNLPLEKHSVRIYQWLIKNAEKQRNWQQMADLLMKLASVYIRLNMKEKAIGLVTSAIQLNTDIKNFTHRYANLITIALLLLDLDEVEKVEKIISTTDFDLKKLSSDDIAKLWLVDGHLLFQSGKTKEAAASLRKVFKKSPPQIPGTLPAKTHLIMAEIYRGEGNREQYFKHLDQASLHFEKAGNIEQAAELHERLLDFCLSSNLNDDAIRHLEWLYSQVEKTNDKPTIRDIADQLGGLYFKVGNKEKSTRYYSIAKGI